MHDSSWKVAILICCGVSAWVDKVKWMVCPVVLRKCGGIFTTPALCTISWKKDNLAILRRSLRVTQFRDSIIVVTLLYVL